MGHDFSQYPDDTMLAEFVMDIYANMDTNEISILYDLEFGEELMYVEYNPSDKSLDFIFAATGAIPFGTPLKQELSSYFESSESVTLIHMDMDTKKAVSGVVVPIKIKQENST